MIYVLHFFSWVPVLAVFLLFHQHVFTPKILKLLEFVQNFSFGFLLDQFILRSKNYTGSGIKKCILQDATKCPLYFSLMAVAITSGPAASVEFFLWCAIACGNLTCHAGKYYFSTSMMCPLFGCFTHKYRLVSTQQWTLSCLAGINQLSVH